LTSVASLSVSTIRNTSAIKDVPSEPPGEWIVCMGQWCTPQTSSCTAVTLRLTKALIRSVPHR
jgi:hypothetical protein